MPDPATPLARVFDKLRQAVLDVPLAEVKRSEFVEKLDAPAFTIGPPALQLVAGGNADFALLVLNEERDPDGDGVFAKNIVGPEGQIVPPHIRFAERQAWLKYKITGTLRADGNVRAGMLGAALNANAKIALADYRRHDATTKADSALDDDRRALRTIFDVADVKKLAAGEALTLQIAGELAASVRFSWSDAIAMSISELTNLAPDALPIAITLDAGLSVAARVRIADEFLLVMSRTPEGLLRIAVKKADSRTLGVKFTASLGVQADGTEAPKDVVDAVVDALAARGGAAAMGADALRTEVTKRLNAIAKQKATIGFAYEYQRVDADTAILDYTLASDDLLDADHDPALDGELATLTERVRGGNGRTLLRFLNEDKLTETTAHGFTLGLGAWSVSFRDSSTLELTERTHIDGNARMISVRGARSYNEPRLPFSDFTWVIDLKADMDHYANKPVTGEFDYGLSYLAKFDRARVDADDVAHLADFAATWGICTPANRDRVATELEKSIGKSAHVDFQLVFKHDGQDPEQSVLLKTIDGTPKIDRSGWANALAAALPFDAGSAARRSVESRVATYAPLWATWLANAEDLSIATWKATIANRVPGILDVSNMAGTSMLWFVTGGYPEMRGRVADFIDGLRLLSVLMTAKDREAQEIRRAYGLLQRFWTQRPYITASASYLLTRAEKAGVLAKVERTMSVTSGGRTVTVSS